MMIVSLLNIELWSHSAIYYQASYVYQFMKIIFHCIIQHSCEIEENNHLVIVAYEDYLSAFM